MNEALEMEIISKAEAATATPFVVDSPEKAAWVVGKIAALDAKEKIITDQSKAMIADIENDRKYLMFRFGAQLEGWAAENLERGKKSVKLLTGTLGFRKSGGRFKVVDEDAALGWATEHLPESVKIVQTVSSERLRQSFLSTGELPAGCDFTPEENKFYVS